jgi:hypothetical protein
MRSFDPISVARRHQLLSKLAGFQMPAAVGSRVGAAGKVIGGVAGKSFGVLGTAKDAIQGGGVVKQRVKGIAAGLSQPYSPPTDPKMLMASRFRNARLLQNQTRGMAHAPGGGFRT